MIDTGKQNLLGVLVDALDYDAAVSHIVAAAHDRRNVTVAAVAVHGVMTGFGDRSQRQRLNVMDIVTPDGQPVRWALNLLHGTHLQDQVRGTTLSLRVLHAAAAAGLPVFFYGSRPETLDLLVSRVRESLPSLVVAGVEASKFRTADSAECAEIAARIVDSGARITFVGLGCPRQEAFVYGFRHLLPMPLLGVGAAFDYLAGTLPPPPERMRRMGLEWTWRLALEPRRLWRRYVFLNPAYMALVTLQATHAWHPSTTGVTYDTPRISV